VLTVQRSFAAVALWCLLAPLALAQRINEVIEVRVVEIEVIVVDRQLSLAIGKKGQNVRLAAKLLATRDQIIRALNPPTAP